MTVPSRVLQPPVLMYKKGNDAVDNQEGNQEGRIAKCNDGSWNMTNVQVSHQENRKAGS